MNMPKKGPELKMPDLKVPDFLLDVYYDLRERHLLPLVGILLVALVALPIALGRGGSESESPEAAGTIATASDALPTSGLVVAKAAPGLRDYRSRLEGRTPHDPFIQQYTENESGGAEGAASSVPSAASSSTEGGEEVTIEPPPGESSSPEPPSSIPVGKDDDELPAGQEIRYFSFVIDVRIVPVASDSGKGKAEPTVRRNLSELTMLPSRETPALTFMTASKDEKKVLMLVSDNVRGIFGDGVCVVGTESCQLLALEPDIPVTIVYGEEERGYRIEILKLHTINTESLDKAPLGKSKQKQGDGKPKERIAE